MSTLKITAENPNVKLKIVSLAQKQLYESLLRAWESASKYTCSLYDPVRLPEIFLFRESSSAVAPV